MPGNKWFHNSRFASLLNGIFFFFFLQKAGQNPLRVGPIDREIFLFQKLEKFNKISRLLVGAILFAASSVINFVIGRVLIWIFIQAFLDFSYFFWERINWFLYLTKIHGNYEFFDGLIICIGGGDDDDLIVARTYLFIYLPFNARPFNYDYKYKIHAYKYRKMSKDNLTIWIIKRREIHFEIKSDFQVFGSKF